jgi:hypothetical protein
MTNMRIHLTRQPLRRCLSALCLPWLLWLPATVPAEEYAYTTNNGALTITGYLMSIK